MKYVVMSVKTQDLNLEIPFIFPNICVHSVIARSLCQSLASHWPLAEIKPVSAGFISSLDIASDQSAYGESESLRLKSRPQDTQLIRMADYGSCHV